MRLPRNVRHAMVAALSGILVWPGSPSAQEPADSLGRGMGFFQVGYMGLDLGELNRSLNGAAYPSLDESFLTLGGTGYGFRGRFLIGGEGHAILGRSETTSDGSTRLSAGGGYGFFRVGYRAVAGPRLDVFPSIGIGGAGL